MGGKLELAMLRASPRRHNTRSARGAVVALTWAASCAIGVVLFFFMPMSGQQSFLVVPHLGRRSAVMFFGGLAASSGAQASFAMSADEEACLSKCVYQCSGGARGKGADFVDRAVCVPKCKDECLPPEKEEELILN